MSQSGPGGAVSLDPFTSIFTAPKEKVIEELSKAARDSKKAAQRDLENADQSSAPIDALVGYHSGLFGPSLSDSVRREAAKRLTGKVRSFTRANQSCDPMMTIFKSLASTVSLKSFGLP